MSSTGSWQGPFGHAGGFGYQSDASGLQLLGHRYYDPSTGRFLTRDPIKDGRNWYAYGAGEAAPTGMVDPTGLWWVVVVGVVGVAVLICDLVNKMDKAREEKDRKRERHRDNTFWNDRPDREAVMLVGYDVATEIPSSFIPEVGDIWKTVSTFFKVAKEAVY